MSDFVCAEPGFLAPSEAITLRCNERNRRSEGALERGLGSVLQGARSVGAVGGGPHEGHGGVDGFRSVKQL